MKRFTMVCAVLAVMTLTQAAWGFTITLDRNYSDAPANTTVDTDDHGSLMGPPLPAPARAGHTFTGWFTTASSGGSRVLSGATGTKFTQDATIYARWKEAAPVNMSDMPQGMKENFDWLKNDRHPREPRLWYSWGGSGGSKNWRRDWIFHQIWAGGGTFNYAVRWQSDKPVTFEQRQQVASMLHESINQWARALIGAEGWPFQEIPVTVVGWSTHDGSLIQGKQPNENVWVNNDHNAPKAMSSDAMSVPISSPPGNLSRLISNSSSNPNYQYPGGLHNRYDQVLWCTSYNFGAAGHGDEWGQRLGSQAVISGAANHAKNGGGEYVLMHEIGHGFSFYDFYGAVGTDRPPATTTDETFCGSNSSLRTVMSCGYGNTLGAYDHWMIRYYWDWIRTESPEWFKLPTTDIIPIASAKPAVAKGAPLFRFDSHGNLRYDPGKTQSAKLELFDSRGRLLKTLRLTGRKATVNTGIKTAAQILLWKAEIDGKAAGQGRMRLLRDNGGDNGVGPT